ncbi:hypothetical protein AM1_3781 [Acaryochloris marina MBIC11017]|uniref:Uncharacterized protein n=1 Tax=Acaryochloris marina (strain MBIC 11017) TaxID=329726 RepID=B0C5P7_ACAM1|nr:hypothetical protein AM1_3781 [Acaryochloris marina MBIC11017]
MGLNESGWVKVVVLVLGIADKGESDHPQKSILGIKQWEAFDR